MTLHKRPLGIAFLSVGLIVNGLLVLLISLYNALSGASRAIGQALLWPQYFIVALDLFNIFLGVLILVLGFGLWRRRRWSWIWTLGIQVIVALAAITAAVVDQINPNSSGLSILSLVGIIAFSLLIIVYLLRPEVKAFFETR